MFEDAVELPVFSLGDLYAATEHAKRQKRHFDHFPTAHSVNKPRMFLDELPYLLVVDNPV